jgi:hypothetical protein
MLFTTREGTSFDTQADLTAAERHILQKLFLWETMASSVAEFREKTHAALANGWNDSGPVKESTALKQIIQELETRVTERIRDNLETTEP